jgi:hypothetical protein
MNSENIFDTMILKNQLFMLFNFVRYPFFVSLKKITEFQIPY